MGKVNYKAIYEQNQDDWKALTKDPQKYEALLAGHYSDSNHFVYELLQNAEDAFDVTTGVYATKVVIEYYEDKLVFYHNGKPFDEADVRGVSSMLMGTKDRDDAQTIGRFGMGFKSVFKYTYQPEIYSDFEAFKITNYLLPVEISEGWDYEREKQSVICKLSNGRSIKPFAQEAHLTKIVIPFKKFGKNGSAESVSGTDVLKKLNELDGEVLLFLTHIRTLYWINKTTGQAVLIALKQDEKDEKLISCHLERTDVDKPEVVTNYLKFKRVFNHPEMDNAEVSVAYRLNSRADNINEMSGTPVYVYFPTKDTTDLPFLIHGSFETAVSREKLMKPSGFNDDLFDVLGDLIASSLLELADRNLITQVFLRRSVLAAFADEEKNGTIPRLKEKVTRIVKEKGILPDRNGKYRKPNEMFIPVPFRMGDFVEKPWFSKALDGKLFVAFNNEREARFNEYYSWLLNDLRIPVYLLSSFAKDLSAIGDVTVPKNGEKFDSIKIFYDFLTDNLESVYETGLSYQRSGPYESKLRDDLKDAWRLLRKAPIVLNRLYHLVPSQIGGKSNVYLDASSSYKSLLQAQLVLKGISDSFSKLLTEGLLIREFNNFTYIKEKVVKKYIEIGDCLNFDDPDHFAKEYIEDLNQILTLAKESDDIQKVKDLIKDAYIIKTKPADGGEDAEFNLPSCCYVPVSDEGIDLQVYYQSIPRSIFNTDTLQKRGEYDFEKSVIDADFFGDYGIPVAALSRLGLVSSPIEEGRRSQNGAADNYWIAVGEYCPEIRIDGLEENLKYISQYPQEKLAQQKSAEILKMLHGIAYKLQGQKRIRKNNPYYSEEQSAPVLKQVVQKYEWLFDKELLIHKPTDMSRYDLNVDLYGALSLEQNRLSILGFVEKEADEIDLAFQKAFSLSTEDKKVLLAKLAQELGVAISSERQDGGKTDSEIQEEFFDAGSWRDETFPIRRVINLEYLVRHVQEQFFCADPVKYEKVWRQIRISKDAKTDRSYTIGMYTNLGGTCICQMCKKPVEYVEVPQIANFGIEMPQLNLCLCRECAAKYRDARDKNKEAFKAAIKSSLMSAEISECAEEILLKVDEDKTLSFTQTHIAEIQEIIRLLTQYGTPSGDAGNV